MPPKIPLVDLKAQYESIREDIDSAIRRVLDHRAFIRGPEVDSFEKEFAEWCGAKYCAGVGSGTEAIYLALRALGVGRDHNVITSPHTFIATTEAITLTGAETRFVDTLPDTFNLDPDLLEQAIDSNTRAIVPVHLNGHPARMDEILPIAERENLIVIEDAAQAHGAIYKGKNAGTLSEAGCFSFFPGKNLGAYGDAGAVVSNDDGLIEKIRKISNHGRSEKYIHDIEGFNFRMDSLQAAILRAKLPHLNGWIEKRREKARRYSDLLQGIKGLTLPVEEDECLSAWHLYVIQVDRRDECLEELNAKGIQAGIHYPIPLHLQPAYAYLGYPVGSFPVAERVAKKILSLPLYPEISDEQQVYVAKCLIQFFTA